MLEQCGVLAGNPTPFAEFREAVAVPILVNHCRECTDLLEALRYPDIGFDAQPAKVIEPVLRDDSNIGRDQIPQPRKDAGGVEIVAIGVTEREIIRLNISAFAPGDADTADMPLAG